MENTDPKAAEDSDEQDEGYFPWKWPELGGRLAAVTTREQRLGVLREFMSEEDAQYFLDLVMHENREKYRLPRDSGPDFKELLDAAQTREEQLAVLREWCRSEEGAQMHLRLMDLEPQVRATPGRAAKLALLRAHGDEESAHGMLHRILVEEKSALLREYLPAEQADEAFNLMGYEEDHPKSAAEKQAAQLDVLREYLPEAQAQEALSRFLGEDKGDMAYIHEH